jgi:hypothetical protein
MYAVLPSPLTFVSPGGSAKTEGAAPRTNSAAVIIAMSFRFIFDSPFVK